MTNGSKKPYTQKADIWSAGCILYSLLSGSQAFNSEKEDIKTSILDGKFFPMRGPRWKNISMEARIFLKKLLKVNSRMRPTAEQALADKWFTSDPFLVNEATMVMECIKKQADINEKSAYPRIASPLRRMALTLEASNNNCSENGTAADQRGIKRKTPQEIITIATEPGAAKQKRLE